MSFSVTVEWSKASQTLVFREGSNERRLMRDGLPLENVILTNRHKFPEHKAMKAGDVALSWQKGKVDCQDVCTRDILGMSYLARPGSSRGSLTALNFCMTVELSQDDEVCLTL